MQAITEPGSDLGIATRLANTVPDPALLTDDFHVAFPVRRFKAAEIVWLNRRWFAAAGIGSADEPALLRHLLDDYALGVDGPDIGDDVFTGPERLLYADRYGAGSGSSHGGSGRVGARGPFNVKGVGRTPLVSRGADWQHSHGNLWLEEAIREAIFGEIVAAEFPHGAIPVVAIIATGIEHVLEDGQERGERALAIRPQFLRVAHLQRSIFFGSSGHSGSDQVHDAARVAAVWGRLWLPEFAPLRLAFAAPDLYGTFLRLGEQYGFGHAVRIWPGPIFSSNIGLDGRLLDFGSMRALPGWSRARGKFASHSFGGESPLVAGLARSLASLGLKHGRPVDADTLVGAFQTGLGRGFDGALDRHGVAGHDRPALHDLFAQQQRRTTGLWEDNAETGDARLAVRYPSLFQPRPSLFREALQTRVRRLLRNHPAHVEGRRRYVTGLIEHEIRIGGRAPWTERGSRGGAER